MKVVANLVKAKEIKPKGLKLDLIKVCDHLAQGAIRFAIHVKQLRKIPNQVIAIRAIKKETMIGDLAQEERLGIAQENVDVVAKLSAIAMVTVLNVHLNGVKNIWRHMKKCAKKLISAKKMLDMHHLMLMLNIWLDIPQAMRLRRDY